jgi:hypothetical protein
VTGVVHWVQPAPSLTWISHLRSKRLEEFVSCQTCRLVNRAIHRTCCKLGRDTTSQYKHGCARLVADNHLENVDIVTDELQLRWHVAVATIDRLCTARWKYPRTLQALSKKSCGLTCSIGAALGKDRVSSERDSNLMDGEGHIT